MNKFLVFCFLFFFLLINFVLSQPPFQQSSGINSFDIDFPKIEFFKFGEDLEFNYHVFNSSGALLENDSTSCVFHLFHFNGSHLIEEDLLFDSVGNDFFFVVVDANLTSLGSYGWLVRCNNSFGSGGFVSSSFMVTPMGFASGLSSLSLVFAFLIIIVFFACIGYFGGSKTMVDEDSGRLVVVERLGFKLFGYGVAVIELLFLVFMVYNKSLGVFVDGLLNANFKIIFVLVIGIAFIGLSLFIFRLINPDDDLQGREGKKW